MPIHTRSALSSDIPALHKIWAAAFGGGDVDDFFSFYFTPELCITAENDGVPVAAGYLIPYGSLACSGATAPCAMIYAVAVLPVCRNRGFGTYVVRGLIELGRSNGYPAIVLCPSDDSLFEYYSERSALRDWFYISERQLIETGPVTERLILTRISAEKYGRLRESLLQDTPHITVDRKAFEYQEILCGNDGGGLYRAQTPVGDACALIERQSDGTIFMKELLSPERYASPLISSVAAEFPAPGYSVRVPAQSVGHDAVRRFGMLAAPDKIMDEIQVYAADMRNSAAPWLGPAFD